MDAVRRATPAPWTRPGEPRVAAHPSWMGMPRVIPPASPAPFSRAPSNRPPADPTRGGHGATPSIPISRPPSMPPLVMPLARATDPPASCPIIQSGHELELEAEVEALRAQVGQLAHELASARARILEESEPEVVRLAVTVATRVVGRELATDPSLVVQWIREGLAALPGREAPVVAVAPDLAAAIALDAALADAGVGGVVVDASLGPGSCELREGSSLVAVGGGERVAAISDALGVEKEDEL